MKPLNGGGRCRHILQPHRGGNIVLVLRRMFVRWLNKHKLTFTDCHQLIGSSRRQPEI